MNHIYDVLIVGAGPAGSSAAYYLAKQGIDVLLLDKCSFPREKACGDALSPRSLTLLREVDLLDDVVRVGYRYDTIKLIAPRCHSATVLLPQRDHRISYGLMLPRLILDDLLLQHAVAHGAQFRSPIRITDILPDEEFVEVQGESHRHLISFRARLAIVAVGANTGLLLRSGLVKKRPRMALGARAYFEGVPDVIDQAQFYLESVFPPGYGWIFPISKTAVNVGIGFLPPKKGKSPTPRTARKAFDAFIHTSLLQHMLGGAHRSGSVMGFPYRCDFPTAPTLGQRVLLVGEAAGLGHPLTGEGIAYALESGKIAAEHLCWMLSTGNVSQESLRWYNWQLRLRFQPLFSLFAMTRLGMPVLSHALPYQLSMNVLVEAASLACRIPLVRSLAFYGLGGVPHTYPLSPTLLFKRRKRRSEADQGVMLLGPTMAAGDEFSHEGQDPGERIVDSLM